MKALREFGPRKVVLSSWPANRTIEPGTKFSPEMETVTPSDEVDAVMTLTSLTAGATMKKSAPGDIACGEFLTVTAACPAVATRFIGTCATSDPPPAGEKLADSAWLFHKTVELASKQMPKTSTSKGGAPAAADDGLSRPMMGPSILKPRPPVSPPPGLTTRTVLVPGAASSAAEICAVRERQEINIPVEPVRGGIV